MGTCRYCGYEIVFRHVAGVVTPIHTDGGGWCDGRGGGSGTRTYRHAGESLCRPSTCPRCGGAVFFIRHNGGTAWLDELGPPWPKHACFEDQSSEQPFGHFRSLQLDGSSDLLLGQVVRLLCSGERTFARTYLALDCSRGRRHCIVVGGLHPQFLGELVLVHEHPTDPRVLGITAITAGKIEALEAKGDCDPGMLELPMAWCDLAGAAPTQGQLERPKMYQLVQKSSPSSAASRRHGRSMMMPCPKCGVLVRKLQRHLRRCPAK